MGLGDHLKELRVKAGLSQVELARRIKIDDTYLSKIETGRQRPSHNVLRSLAKEFGEEPGRLMVMAGSLPPELQGRLQPSMPSGHATPRALVAPTYRTSFIDRDEDRRSLMRLLESPSALVSLTGAPGSGKTRLLAEIARELGQSRPIVWVTVHEDKPEAIEAAIGHARLQTDAVVVLDDAERNLVACSNAAERIAAEGVAVVATCRQPLLIDGHQQMWLESLPRPDRHQRPAAHDGGPDPDLSRLQEQESVRLFVDRAVRARPDFRLDRANASAVFDVCRWLDGLPLAIELAALRLRHMTVNDLAANVGKLLAWLINDAQGVPDRHASLENAIGWSFERLNPRQRSLATRLSLFQTNFSLEDAVKVTADEQYSEDTVQATVLELVEHALLDWRPNANGRAAYRWHQPIRQYGERQLKKTAEYDQVEIRYHKWVQEVVNSLEANLPRRESEWERLAELTPELVSTIYTLPSDEQDAAIKQMTEAISKSLQFGNLIEHVTWFSGQFNKGPTLFRHTGMLARVGGDFDVAQTNLVQAYQLALNNHDESGQANAALDLAENHADLQLYDEARKYVERAGALYEKLNDDRGRIEVLNLRGKLAQESGDLEIAETLFEEAGARAEQVEDRRLVAYSLHSLGVCHYLQRRITSARGHLEESLRIRESMRNQRGVARVVEALALVESEVRNHQLALQLLAAARQYRRSSRVLGIPLWWKDRLDRVEEEARISLVDKPEVVRRCLEAGAAMTLAEASRLGTRVHSTLPTGPLGDPVTTPPLRRPIPPATVVRDELAHAAAEVAPDRAPAALERASRQFVESGGSDAQAYRGLHQTRFLALAEPAPSRVADLLCFAVDPHHYRGVILPAFASGRALAEALARHPEWASRPIVEIGFEQLRGALVAGEMAVINPWTAYEFRVSSVADGHESIEFPSTDAPTALNRAISSS
jgi:non-specific serine/threonine protein kinase